MAYAAGVSGSARKLIKSEAVASDVRAFAWPRCDGDEPAPTAPLADRLAPGRRGSGYGLDQIMTEAEAILRDAQDEADRLLSEARRRAQSERDQLWQEALDEARREVAGEGSERRESADELGRAAALLGELAGQLQARAEERLSALEGELIERAFHIARKVVDREIETHPEVVLDSVRAALKRAGSGEMTVKLHPADLPIVQQALLELQAERSVGDLLSFEEDSNIERGGCLVVGDNGTINAQPGSKLEQLRSLAEG